MQKPYSYLLAAVAGGILAFAAVSSASATTMYDHSLADPPGTYFGSGNPSGHWAITTSDYSGSFGSGSVELGLKAQGRYSSSPTVLPDLGTNIYRVQTGPYGSGSCPGCALWNFDFSVNLGTSGLNLGEVTSDINILNVGNGQSFHFDPFTTFAGDNSAYDGTNTRNGNTETPAQTTDVGFQNSENLGFAFVPFFNSSFGFDPSFDDTYIVTLALAGPSNENLGSVSETIIAGVGATPIPATLPLFLSGIGLFGLIVYRRKKGATPSGLAAA